MFLLLRSRLEFDQNLSTCIISLRRLAPKKGGVQLLDLINQYLNVRILMVYFGYKLAL